MQALKVLTVSLGAEHGEALLVVALLLARYQEDAVPAAWQSACNPVAQLPRTRRAESKSGSVASSACARGSAKHGRRRACLQAFLHFCLQGAVQPSSNFAHTRHPTLPYPIPYPTLVSQAAS